MIKLTIVPNTFVSRHQQIQEVISEKCNDSPTAWQYLIRCIDECTNRQQREATRRKRAAEKQKQKKRQYKNLISLF